jgi:hypothetical protein
MCHDVIDGSWVIMSQRISLILFLPATAPECFAEALMGMRSLPSRKWSTRRQITPADPASSNPILIALILLISPRNQTGG